MKTNRIIIIFCLLQLVISASYGRDLKQFADSIRRVYKIPELAYAVVSASKVYELEVIGYKKTGTKMVADEADLFRIGSNTKGITGFIAATLVKQGKLSWNTKFFDLFPELRSGSRVEYRDVTLLNLLSFRTKLFPYTYTYPVPVKGQFSGSEEQQRYQFAKWFFSHDPSTRQDTVNFSNLGYVSAGLMLEKVTGKTYKQLVTDMATDLNMEVHFGQPNNINKLQPWGHNANLVPEPPGDDFKLNWLLPAGNICMSLPEYAKFIQLQLLGLAGKSAVLKQEEFNFLHFGLSRFSVGWSNGVDEQGRKFSYNNGNPGTFLSGVYLFKDMDRAFILLSNVQSDEAEEGLEVLYNEMKRRYAIN